VFEKFAGILGPTLFAMTSAVTGSSRGAILSVVAFFVIGAALLVPVDVVAGRRAIHADG
jgi:UMF1 family MFS transporter